MVAVKACMRCGAEFLAQRSDAKVCGATCRKRMQRAAKRDLLSKAKLLRQSPQYAPAPGDDSPFEDPYVTAHRAAIAAANDARNAAPPRPVTMAATRMLVEIEQRQRHEAHIARLSNNPWGLDLWRR